MHTFLGRTFLLALALGTVITGRADDAIFRIKFGGVSVRPLRTRVNAGGYSVVYPAAIEAEVISPLPVERSLDGEAMTLAVSLTAGQSVVEKTSLEDGKLVLSLYPARSSGTVGPSPVHPPAPVTRAPPPGAAGMGTAAGLTTPDAGTPASPTEDALKAKIAGLAGRLEQTLKAPPLDPAAKADFALPLSPAAAVLSDTTEVVRPVTPREFGSSVLSHFNKDGTLASGFSLAATPYFLLRGQEIDIREYRKDRMVQFWSRMQVSAAAQPGSGSAAAAKPAQFALGLSGLIFDDGDLRLDEKIDQDFSTVFADALSGYYAGGDRPVLGADSIKGYDNAIAAARKRHWNSASLGFGVAPRWESDGGAVRHARNAGGAAWAGLTQPGFGSLAESSQFLFQSEYRFDDPVPPTLAGGPGTKQDTLSIGTQFRFGTAEFNGFAQAFYKRRWTAGQSSKGSYSYEIGLEHRLYEGVWLVLSYANDNDAAANGNQPSAVKTGLRYGFGDGPKLKQ